jgi:hypothetical protein
MAARGVSAEEYHSDEASVHGSLILGQFSCGAVIFVDGDKMICGAS